MARNEEKSLTLFNKWQTFKQDFHSSLGNRRPLLAQDCDSLADAQKWRRELIRDVTKKVSTIHNASLGEHRIREINDEINKMNRQKHFWESRIRELGGDVSKGRQYIDVEGKELPGAPGYKYYGVAKDLPGVRELFAEKDDEANKKRQKRSRGELYKLVTPDYYGYRDDDDGILSLKEAQREEELVAEAEAHFQERRAFIVAKVKGAHAARLRGDSQGGGAGLSAEELQMLETSDGEGEGEDEEALLKKLSGGASSSSGSNSSSGSSGSSSSNNDSGSDSAGGSGGKASVSAGGSSGKDSGSAATNAELRSHVALPSTKEMDKIILEEKKKLLWSKFSQ